MSDATAIDHFFSFPGCFDTNLPLNESIARIEALKVRILNSHLPEQEKQGIFQELDILRGVFLETIAQGQPNSPSQYDQNLVPRYGVSPMVLEGIVGHNKKMTDLLNVIAKVAPSKLPVLLEGETGTGKELLARIVHLNSGREKFIAVNCGAFPPGIIESELFGHVKGAFTNANTERKGKFDEANGGTIFLDEIGDMDLTAQVKLLRVLEQGELQRVGSDQTHTIDVRVITATNKFLDQMVFEGKFREDLLYRINVCPLTVPPLRERRDEIEILLEFFLQERGSQGHSTQILSSDLRNFLLHDYDFPGNIRELKNIAQYIAHTAEREVTILDLPDRYRRAYDRIRGEPGATIQGGVSVARDEAERRYLVDMLTKYKGNVEKVCADTALSRARIYQMMKKYALKALDFR